jgi:cytidylate kinase
MNLESGLGRCLSFINCQLRPADRATTPGAELHRPAVTISRQAGCGALVVAEKLAELLQQTTPRDEPHWTVFDRNLMERVLADHHLPGRLAKFLPEDRASELQDIIDDLSGLQPPSWTMIAQTSETILKLAELGNVILIGRAGNIIASRLPHVRHVRLIAPLEKRVAYAHTLYQMSERDARTFCLREDAGRQRYVKKYFKTEVADPLLYHLVINTGLVSFDEAARLIAEAVRGPERAWGGSTRPVQAAHLAY